LVRNLANPCLGHEPKVRVAIATNESWVRLIQSNVSNICLLVLFMASIIVENLFVHLCLILVLLGATSVVGVGADTTNVVKISKIFTMEGLGLESC
jgi:general stress protein CsbA